MRQALRTLTAALALGAVAALSSAPAQADQIVWKPCGDSNSLACGHLTVPLDPSGATPGTITLALRRHRAPVGESKDAVIALAGGPGQSAIPFIGEFGQILGPIASTRDVIAFDQRGTGLSHPLSCPAFEHLRGDGSPQAVAICAGQIGATRGLYTTADTVADIEAIRQAGGYEKLVLYGTSYGTKVAERYAQDHPSRVEALVLDSVVPPSGPEPFDETSFQAVGRVLRQLCAGGACSRITRDPVGDLARLVKQMGRRGVSGRLIDEKGEGSITHISSNDLIAVLFQGDLDPILRSEFPAAVRSAASGDRALLARLMRRAESEPEGGEQDLSEGFDSPLYFSTICDETSFPWKPTGSPKAHLLEALAALRAAPAKTFAPFTSANALALSDVPVCADWPSTAGGPEVDDAPLPNVPTLILSGANDLRTPTANARVVAAEIPDAQLLVVPNTGHSVLGSDPTSCAHDALRALFAGKRVEQCGQHRPPELLLPTPLAPRSLSTVSPMQGTHGKVGRTLGAVLLTLGDFEREVTLAALEQAGGISLLEGLSTVSVGGLRAGWGGSTNGHLALHSYSYVPGVSVSGKSSPGGDVRLRIGGRRAAHGTISLSARGTLTGALAGHRVHLTATSPGGPGSLGLKLGESLAGSHAASDWLSAPHAAGPLAHRGPARSR